MNSTREYDSFTEFWPFYLSQHSHPWNMRLHVLGMLLAILVIATALALHQPLFVFLAPVVGYSLSWIGHLMIEKNKPATWRYPIYSLMGDIKMFFLYLSGRKLL